MKIRVQHHIPKLLFITGRSIALQSSWRCVSRTWAFPDAGSTVNSTLVAGLTRKIWKQKVASVLAILLVAWPLIVLTLWNNQRSIIHHLYCRWRVKTSLHVMTNSLFTYQHQQCDKKKALHLDISACCICHLWIHLLRNKNMFALLSERHPRLQQNWIYLYRLRANIILHIRWALS